MFVVLLVVVVAASSGFPRGCAGAGSGCRSGDANACRQAHGVEVVRGCWRSSCWRWSVARSVLPLLAVVLVLALPGAVLLVALSSALVVVLAWERRKRWRCRQCLWSSWCCRRVVARGGVERAGEAGAWCRSGPKSSGCCAAGAPAKQEVNSWCRWRWSCRCWWRRRRF